MTAMESIKLFQILKSQYQNSGSLQFPNRLKPMGIGMEYHIENITG